MTLNAKRGFTLVEILVVIGIIGALVSVIIVGQIRCLAKSREAVCVSNMHQLVLALQMYREDNSGTRACVLGELYSTYVSKELLQCPVDDTGGYANALAILANGAVLFPVSESVPASYLYVGGLVHDNHTWDALENTPGVSYLACVLHGSPNGLDYSHTVPVQWYTGRVLQAHGDGSVVTSYVDHNALGDGTGRPDYRALDLWALFVPPTDLDRFKPK